MSAPSPTCWVEIQPAALSHNFQQVASLVGSETGVIAVVKANGYGHGLQIAGKAFAEAGATALAVTNLEEGVGLREAGIDTPILVLLPLLDEQTEIAAAHELTVTVSRLEQLHGLALGARRAAKKLKCHLYVETGMGNGGLREEELPVTLEGLRALPQLALAGVYTHLPRAMEGASGYTERQLEHFRRILDDNSLTAESGLLLHACNSAGSLLYGSAGLNAVRVGTLLYGQQPVAGAKQLELKRALILKSRIVNIWQVAPGECLGYAGEFRAPRPMRVGLVPAGYSVGVGTLPISRLGRPGALTGGLGILWKRLRRRTEMPFRVGVQGQSAPVVGRLAMNQLLVDLSRLPEAHIGDEVELPAMWALLDSGLPRIIKSE